MYNIFSNKPLKIKKFSYTNLVLFILLVVSVMGFHVWIVVKTLTILDDVSSVIILKHGKILTKRLPDLSIRVLIKDPDLQTQINSLDYCSKRNCILVDDKCYSGDDYTMFDAVAYGEISFNDKGMRNRSERSKILNIFTSTSPPKDVVCDPAIDNFFHLTLTYRLDSDVVYKNFVVTNFNGKIIAPAIAPTWNTNYTSIFGGVKSIITRKRKAVAYLNYGELEDRKHVPLAELKEVLSEYSLQMDTYNCSDYCANDTCFVTLPDDYYFYIISEKHFAEDYVTDRILQAYGRYVVPVIYGGANYTRFLPPHSYIDGRLTTTRDVVAFIRQSMDNFTYFEDYFKWRSMYTIDRYQPFCDLCNVLNGRSMNMTAKKDLRRWWYGEDGIKRCMISTEDIITADSKTEEITASSTDANKGVTHDVNPNGCTNTS